MKAYAYLAILVVLLGSFGGAYAWHRSVVNEVEDRYNVKVAELATARQETVLAERAVTAARGETAAVSKALRVVAEDRDKLRAEITHQSSLVDIWHARSRLAEERSGRQLAEAREESERRLREINNAGTDAEAYERWIRKAFPLH